jgi:hypothetical protein
VREIRSFPPSIWLNEQLSRAEELVDQIEKDWNEAAMMSARRPGCSTRQSA